MVEVIYWGGYDAVTSNEIIGTESNPRDWASVPVKPVRICNRSWLGLNVIVLKGVEVGEGADLAAGSVVTKKVPPWTVVAGNPAKAIREIPVEDR